MNRYLNSSEIFFLYTILKNGYNGENEVDFDFFHPIIIPDMPRVLDFFIREGLITDLYINIYGEKEKVKQNIEVISLSKEDDTYMKVFNKYAGCDPYDRRITFSFKGNIKKEEIKNYCLKYFKEWEKDKINLEFINYIKPSLQIERFSRVLYDEIDRRLYKFRYDLKYLDDIDELSLIFYFYINGYLDIKNDCLNIIDGTKKIWFNLIINNSINKVLNKYNDKVTLSDTVHYYKNSRQLVIEGEKIILNKSDTNLLMGIFLENYGDEIDADFIEEKLKSKGVDLKKKLKMSKRLYASELINDIITNGLKDTSRLKNFYSKISKKGISYKLVID